ncbi:Down syndrome cell adhesion molecule-like protein Dscam2, partial [Amphibalanus amphitrite]|uniref:Down syndrome cell adhesion molecule-like protein Dscam2 n=1 Tax=Amphibalanus amphitrite TaxID=1232801 RepID=UPI001C91788E
MSPAMVLQSYRVTATDGSAPLGQTAVLTCHVPDHVRVTVRVISWGVQGRVNVYPTLLGDDKYHMVPSGELLVRDVTSDDVTDRFLCRTVHLLTDQHVTSEPSARVVIRERTPSPGGSLPVIVASSSALHVRAGDDAVLFCVAQSDERTPPRVSWTRDVTGRPEPVPAPVTGHGDVTASGHVLAIRSARPRHAGWYHCRADGGNGHVTEKLRLHVQ